MTAIKVRDLAPCPFCGAEAETDFMPDFGSYRIECFMLNCATGPICDTEEGAVAAWNRRASAEPAALKALSDKTGLTVAEHIRRAIDAYLRKQK